MSKSVCAFKTVTCFLMQSMSVAIIYDRLSGNPILPYYFKFTEYDFLAYSLVLTITVLLQISLMLHRNSVKCLVMSNLTLQFSGLFLFILGMGFTSAYPPLNELMIVLPVWGVSCLIIGRYEGESTRGRYCAKR